MIFPTFMCSLNLNIKNYSTILKLAMKSFIPKGSIMMKPFFHCTTQVSLLYTGKCAGHSDIFSNSLGFYFSIIYIKFCSKCEMAFFGFFLVPFLWGGEVTWLILRDANFFSPKTHHIIYQSNRLESANKILYGDR